jgi:flagellar basal-body rod protein FlgB
MSTFLNTRAFDYINVMDKAADAAWLRNDAIANNIANIDTPYYKRQDVNFEDALSQALKWTHFADLDNQVHNVSMRRLSVSTYTDIPAWSYRLDDNNVDIDTESAELAANQIKYNGIADSIRAEFQNLKTVIK